jgi:hypothetical protein
MNDQFTFSRDLEERMRHLRFDLNILKVKASEDQNAREEMTEMLYDIQEKLDHFESRLQELTTASPQFWPKVKSLVMKAFEDASFSVQSAKSRYLH